MVPPWFLSCIVTRWTLTATSSLFSLLPLYPQAGDPVNIKGHTSPCSESSLGSISFRLKIRVFPAANQALHICCLPPLLHLTSSIIPINSSLQSCWPPCHPSGSHLSAFRLSVPFLWGCHDLPHLHRAHFSSQLQCSFLERPPPSTRLTGLSPPMLSLMAHCSFPSDYRL